MQKVLDLTFKYSAEEPHQVHNSWKRKEMVEFLDRLGRGRGVGVNVKNPGCVRLR